MLTIRDLAIMGLAWCGAGVAFEKATLGAGGLALIVVAAVNTARAGKGWSLTLPVTGETGHRSPDLRIRDNQGEGDHG